MHLRIALAVQSKLGWRAGYFLLFLRCFAEASSQGCRGAAETRLLEPFYSFTNLASGAVDAIRR